MYMRTQVWNPQLKVLTKFQYFRKKTTKFHAHQNKLFYSRMLKSDIHGITGYRNTYQVHANGRYIISRCTAYIKAHLRCCHWRLRSYMYIVGVGILKQHSYMCRFPIKTNQIYKHNKNNSQTWSIVFMIPCLHNKYIHHSSKLKTNKTKLQYYKWQEFLPYKRKHH